MRTPQDLPRRPRRAVRRGRLWLVIAVVVVIVLLASLRTLATFYTDYLWFGSVQLGGVWRRLLEVKVELFFGFAADLLRAHVGEPRRGGPPGPDRARPGARRRTGASVSATRGAAGGPGPEPRLRRDRADRGHRRPGTVAQLPPLQERRLLRRHGSPVPQERGFLRLQAPVPVLHRQLVVRDAGGGGDLHLDRPLPQRRDPRAVGNAQRGPPGQGAHLGPPCVHGTRQGRGVRVGPLQPRSVPERLRAGRRLHRRPCPPARADAAHLDLAARGGHPAHQHPEAGLGAAHPRCRSVGIRGHRGGRHLPGHRPGHQGEPGPEQPRAPVHHTTTSTPRASLWASTT